MDDRKEILSLAQKFFDAIERGDVGRVRQAYAPDAQIWHNTDGLGQSVDENIATLEGFIARIDDRRYGNRRLDVFPGGFVQRHVLTGTRKDGKIVALDACIVCAVEHGRITRLDEYFDSAAVERFRNMSA